MNNSTIDPLDPAFQSKAISSGMTLLTLASITCLGSFFLGALVTSIRKGINEEGWFRDRNEKRED